MLYCSIHSDPKTSFPYSSGYEREKGRGAGLNYNINFPLPQNSDEQEYRDTLNLALSAIKDFEPVYIIVSAGFDTYKDDPIAGLGLSIPFFEKLGEDISGLGIPSLIIQEGGYNVESLGKICHTFLSAF